jgi:predicted secreted protein
MATNALLSKLMNVVIDSSTVGCATDFSLSINRDLIEIACLGQTGGKESLPDLYSWNVSGSGMVLRTLGAGEYSMFDVANKILTSDASVLVQIVPDVSSMKYYSGGAYFSSLSMEGGVGSPVTYSFELTGSGTLNINTTA